MTIAKFGMGNVINEGKEDQRDYERNHAIPMVPDRPIESCKGKHRDEAVEENVRQPFLVQAPTGREVPQVRPGVEGPPQSQAREAKRPARNDLPGLALL